MKIHHTQKNTNRKTSNHFMQKLKERWNIRSSFQLIMILLVFSINGSLAVWIAKPIMEFIGLDREFTNAFIYWPLRILLVFVAYQFTLPMVGFCLGQYTFFKRFSKRTFGFFVRKSKSLPSEKKAN